MFELEEQREELLKEIEDYLERKQYAELRDLLLPLEAADIAALFNDMDERVPVLFRLLPKELAAEVFVELESEEQELLIKGFSNAELKDVLTSYIWMIPSISWKRCPPMWSPAF